MTIDRDKNGNAIAWVTKIETLTDRANKGQRLIYVKCPFCGKTHQHGGGKEGDLLLGSRAPHCLEREQSCYILKIPAVLMKGFRLTSPEGPIFPME